MTKPAKIAVGRIGQPKLGSDGRTMVVSIPISFRRQGGRKTVVTPSHAPAWSPPSPRIDNTIVKALVRAHRWRGLLESGTFGSVRELARAEKINESYLCRVLRLTLLSPKLTEAILNGLQPQGLDLGRLLKVLPAEWDNQEAELPDLEIVTIRQSAQRFSQDRLGRRPVSLLRGPIRGLRNPSGNG